MNPRTAIVTGDGIVIVGWANVPGDPGPKGDGLPTALDLPSAEFELHELENFLRGHGWVVSSRWQAVVRADGLNLEAFVLPRR